jgi:predicted DNA-binding transcriptional regulator AlpA
MSAFAPAPQTTAQASGAVHAAETPRTKPKKTAFPARARALPHAASLNSELSEIALPIRLIPLAVVCEMLGLKRSAVLEKVATGELPAPIKFGTSRRAAARWIEQEIVDYIWAKAAQRPAYSIQVAARPCLQSAQGVTP